MNLVNGSKRTYKHCKKDLNVTTGLMKQCFLDQVDEQSRLKLRRILDQNGYLDRILNGNKYLKITQKRFAMEQFQAIPKYQSQFLLLSLHGNLSLHK